jgi:hypothetical protein
MDIRTAAQCWLTDKQNRMELVSRVGWTGEQGRMD